ncbi:MAG: CRISPR-associated helicase Cas3' [Bacilli bacterium]|nr:CRISPR-associated helicase Cas3' [Bacilli bacterium]
MYFDNIVLFDYKNEIKNADKLYAHKDEEGYELLEDHMKLSLFYFNKLMMVKNLDGVFERLENCFFKGCSVECVSFYRELFYNSIYCHDLGKSNPNFQVLKMSNVFFTSFSDDSKHSFYSTLIYLNYYFNKLLGNKEIKSPEERTKLFIFMLMNGYVISKHHGYLESFNKYLRKLTDWFKSPIDEIFLNYNNYNFEKLQLKIKHFIECSKQKSMLSYLVDINSWDSSSLFMYNRILFCCLVSSDFYSTYHYQNKQEIEDFGLLENIDEYITAFYSSGVNKKIKLAKEYGLDVAYPKNEINKLRTELFIEAESCLLKNLDYNIYFFEAPTGSGKTNTAINLSLQLIKNNPELNKIFYVFPFNTLVEQTNESCCNLFSSNLELVEKIAVINSIRSIKEVERDADIDYESSLLGFQFLHYPISLTTNIKLFEILFGVNRNSIFPLMQLANSVIVLDEIQSYSNKVWKEFTNFMKQYSELLNIKIIIMSATLPNLSLLSDSSFKYCNLIVTDKYSMHPYFKDRVLKNYRLLDISPYDVFNVLKSEVVNEYKKCKELGLEGKVLIEFINKKSAYSFYRELKDFLILNGLNVELLLITGDDSIYEKKEIVRKVKNGKDIILIGTQVVEAGLDIDMDLGFKDISILDSDKQFEGRINRNCFKKGCKIFFFNLYNINTIYKSDVRTLSELTLLNDEIKKMFVDNTFNSYYDRVLSHLNILKESKQIGTQGILDALSNLDFMVIREIMKLIDYRPNYTVFLNREIILEDGSVLKGSNIWTEYKDIWFSKILGYAERKVQLSKIKEKLDYFTYTVYSDSLPDIYNDKLGDLYYIADGKKYLKDGKLDIDLFNTSKKLPTFI